MYSISVVDGSGVEVGRFDQITDETGLISIGGGAGDHINVPGLVPEQVYLYVSDGQMVLEDAAGNGVVVVDGYALEGPCFITPENIVTFQGYNLHLLGPDIVGAAPPGEEALLPPPPADEAGYSSHEGASSASGDFDGAESAPYEPAESQGHYYQAGAAQVAMDLAYAPGGPAVSRGPLKLTALSGLMTGKEFLLEENNEYDVGRDEDEALEVPLDDPTVSRRHARLRVSEGGVMVLDLRSTNGTFINGQEVKRELAVSGDRLRFAEVGFKLSKVEPLAETKEKKAPNSRKLIIMAAAAVVLVGLVVAGYAIKGRIDRKKSQVKQVARKETLGERQRRQFREAMDRGRKSLDSQEWSVAISAFEEALEDFPSKQDKERAEDLLEKAKKEQKNKNVLAEANKAFSTTGGDIEGYQKALKLFKRIPMESFYSVEARDKIERISLRLARLYLTQALTYAKGRRLNNRAKAHKFYCDYFDVLGNVGRTVVAESKYRDQLKDLEKDLDKKKRLLKRRKIDFSPCEAARFLQKPIMIAGKEKIDPAEEIRKKYENEDLVGVLMLYHKGETDQAISRLIKLRKKSSLRKKAVLTSELHQQLAMIKGKLAEGDSALQRGDVKKADEAYSDAFKVEERILPEGLKSQTRENASTRLADKYNDLGEAQFKLGRYKEAYKHWSRGKHFDPSQTKILNGLVQLEREAQRLLQQAKSTGSSEQAKDLYEMVKSITTPDSPTHKEAVEASSK